MAAKRLGVSDETIRRYLRADPPIIRGVKLPLEWRIPEEEVERLLSEGVNKAGRPKEYDDD